MGADRSEFAVLLAGMRKSLVGSRRVFAHRCGYSTCCVKTWETGLRFPSPLRFGDVLATLEGSGATPSDLHRLLSMWLAVHGLRRFDEDGLGTPEATTTN